ncbi:MAG: CapA family protein [Myxococcota bacterium]
MILWLLGCDPYRAWPEPETYFPYVHTPEDDLEAYEEVRFETQTWTVEEDYDQLALYVRKSAEHRKGAPVESLDHFEAMRAKIPPLGDGARVSFAGDVMWIGDNWSAFADPVAHLFDGDLRVANLETPTSPLHSTEQGDLGLYAFNAPPELLDGLPVDVLQLNNNHSLDAGDDGLAATVDEVEARGIVQTGVDTHARVGDVALLSYTWGVNDPSVPTSHELFVVPFGHVGEPIDLSGVAADIAATGAETVVVLLHWGFEYEYYPDPHFLVLAREIVAAGADLIVGHGPHVVQPPELCHVNRPEEVPGVGTCSLRTDDGEPRTAAILYSLGNFASIMPTAACEVGIVATVSLDPDVTGLGWAAVQNVEGPAVVPVEDAEEEARLDAHLGDGWKR